MDIVEFSLPAKVWGGLVTKYAADTKQVDADEFTEGTSNVLTNATGNLTKRSGGVFYNTTAFSTPNKDQYEAVFSSGVRHLLIMEAGNLRFSSGGGTFSLVTAGYTATANMEFSMYKNRVYFGNGVNASQTYDIVTSYGGVAYTAPQTKVMGATAPSSAPTAGAPTAGGNVPDGAHTYKVTFLYYDSEESNGSPASGVQTAGAGNNTIPLTTIAIGGYGVTARKIYRDDNDGNYVLVGTIANNTATTFSDTAALGTTPIPTDNGGPPLFSLIVTHRDRLWVAGVDANPSVIYWSEAGLPDIFGVNNQLLCNPRDPITALAVYNDKVLVFNRNSMGQILGSTSADFRYSEISPSVGCVDNRSIQTRTIRGVPTLIWLANDNIYQYNGSSISAIADDIQDQIQFNIQQATQVKGKNTQSDQTDFQGGTSSAGIDISTIPGTITVKGYQKAGFPATLVDNPTKLWDTESEWEGGSSLTNVATNDGTNTMKVPTRHTPAFTEGSHNNTVEISSTLRTPISTDFTGETLGSIEGNTQPLDTASAGAPQVIAQSFVPPRSGVLTSFTIDLRPEGAAFLNFKVWDDSGGSPNTVLFSQISAVSSFPEVFLAGVGYRHITISVAVSMTAGQRYWYGAESSDGGPGISASGHITRSTLPVGRVNFIANGTQKGFDLGVWSTLLDGLSPFPVYPNIPWGYAFTSAAVATSGIWIGPTYDSFSDSAVADTIEHTGSFPSGTASMTTIEAANDTGFTSGVLSQTFNSLNGSTAVSLSGRRYWRIKIQLTTTDDRITAQIGLPTLKFAQTATWISEAIDHTVDITTLDALVLTSVTPVGTTATVTIATSADDITYSSYTALGSAVALRYSKVKVEFTSTSDNVTTSTINSVRLDWTVVANLISSDVDTSSTPAGWELFQADFDSNSGTVLFEMRTAATQGGLAGASWTTVTNGAFITAAVNQWFNWRVTLTAHANQVPVVRSVIVNWFISAVDSIRVASLFFNRQYYLAAAEFGEVTNNVIFLYDETNTWKLFRGITANTMGTFFNNAYYGSSVIGKMVKWLDPVVLTDQGSNIEFDVRTKAFKSELGNETLTKFVRQLILQVIGTGARITPTYSVDGGTTFLPMVNIVTGLSYYDTLTDENSATVRFTPQSSTIVSGRAIMFRLYSNDANTVEIEGLRAKCWISPRAVLNA